MPRREGTSGDAQAARHTVWLLVARRLPADARAVCACVSRGCRQAMCDQSLAAFLDLSTSSGVTCTVNNIALRAAAAVAGGRLQMLDVRGRTAVSVAALVSVGAENATTLRELSVGVARARVPKRPARTCAACSALHHRCAPWPPTSFAASPTLRLCWQALPPSVRCDCAA